MRQLYYRPSTRGANYASRRRCAGHRNVRDRQSDAERWAVRGYTAICNMTASKDHRTYDLALAILHEEIEQEA
ncbi:MAG: hypothetical protein ABSC22_12895 [Roseiarcus sp.]